MSEQRWFLKEMKNGNIILEDYKLDKEYNSNNLRLLILEMCNLLNQEEESINELEETNKAMYNRLNEQSEIIYQLIQKLKEYVTEKEWYELIKKVINKELADENRGF